MERRSQGNWRSQADHIRFSAVTLSVLAVAFLATVCSAGTIQNRPGVAIPVATGGKTPGRRIMHAAFANAGKQPGLEIWRIENFEPVAYPKNQYGKFYMGDSFIVLNTQQSKDKKLFWDVHYWLGSETSTDEAGAAAILTVQLDDLLNGGPVQHREVQDHESQLFLSYFKSGVRYEKGGVGSGFRHVETNAQGEKRLFQVKGKRNVRVCQVNLSVSSMNKGDCFILDAGNKIYVYVGTKSKNVEKLKAISVANQIRDQDHNGRAKVEIVDSFSSDSDKMNFFEILGSGSPTDVPDDTVAEEDAAFETADVNSVALYRVSNEGGPLKVDQISSKPLRQEMLDTKDCFILETCSGLYVWVGRRATEQEKSQSMIKAQEFLKNKKSPAWTQIHRIVEGAESAPFKQFFATWKDVGMSHTRLIRSALGYDSDVPDEDFDDEIIETLKKSGGRAIGFMPDNAEQDVVQIWQYSLNPQNNNIVKNEVPQDFFTSLLGFGSYIIQYDYSTKQGENGVVLYVWEGHHSGKGAIEKAYADATVMAKLLGAIVVRTTQGHEPRHFLKIFKGKLITSYSSVPDKPELFRIRGTDETDVRANEVKADSSSLASDDVFALVKPAQSKVYIWLGLGAAEFEKHMATTRFVNFWNGFEIETIEEGAEPDDFWEDLNGEGIYDRSVGTTSSPLLDPRMFHCQISASRKISAEEIPNFQQADLEVDDIMLIDGGDEIYIWVGEGTTEEERQISLEMVKEYIRKDPTERTIDTVSIIVLKQGKEPKCFKRMFPEWEDGYWESIPSYEEVKKRLFEANERIEDNDI